MISPKEIRAPLLFLWMINLLFRQENPFAFSPFMTRVRKPTIYSPKLILLNLKDSYRRILKNCIIYSKVSVRLLSTAVSVVQYSIRLLEESKIVIMSFKSSERNLLIFSSTAVKMLKFLYKTRGYIFTILTKVSTTSVIC